MDNIDILLVEDSAEDADLTRRALARNRLGEKLFHVEDGAEALDWLLATGPYQARDPAALPRLVLLDLKLPRLNGLELLKRIKTDARTRALPVVMLSSSNEERDVRASYEYGASSYVVKPVGFDEYMEVIATLGRYWLSINQSLQNTCA